MKIDRPGAELGLLGGDEPMATTNRRLFLIAGATGKTSTTTAYLLLERGYRVRAFVHRPDSRSSALAAARAEIVAGDLLSLNDVSSAMRGVSGAYFAYPIAPGLLDATVVVAQAAAEAGVRSIVNMSQISARREASSNAARQHWLAERLLDRSPTLSAHLKPTFLDEWVILGWRLQGDRGECRRTARPSDTSHDSRGKCAAQVPRIRGGHNEQDRDHGSDGLLRYAHSRRGARARLRRDRGQPQRARRAGR